MGVPRSLQCAASDRTADSSCHSGSELLLITSHSFLMNLELKASGAADVRPVISVGHSHTPPLFLLCSFITVLGEGLFQVDEILVTVP